MMDSLMPESRSLNMAKIRGKDAGRELPVRRAARAPGLRFRLRRRDLPGTSDPVIPGRRIALFAHGCFGNRHPGCRLAYTPKPRIEFWRARFYANMVRDARKLGELSEAGWTAVTIWECETRDQNRLREIIRERVMQPPAPIPDR